MRPEGVAADNETGAASALRVFHIPSHLAYVAKLVEVGFAPVAAPTGGPMRVGALLALPSWNWFDVLHVHTVELASRSELQATLARARAEDKHLVMTVHDLQPNIESDAAEFRAKLRLVLDTVDATATLTEEARRWLTAEGLLRRHCAVVPHGAALPLEVLGPVSRRPGPGVAAYGGLRPNRDLIVLLKAWQSLSAGARPPLRILLRDVSDEDERRYTTTLRHLRLAAARHADLSLDVQRGFIDAAQLAAWLRQSRVLALPYRSITHSGQMEVAIDVGLGVLAPDVATLRDQVASGPAPDWPITWFPEDTIRHVELFAAGLHTALGQRAVSDDYARRVRRSRSVEYQLIIDAHARLYKTGL